MTQGELAEAAGCSLKTIAKIESGERRPSKQLAELLASALGVTPDDLPAFMLLARGAGVITGPLTSSAHTDRSGPHVAEESGLPEITNKLPAPLTEFVGREKTVALLCATLRRPYTRLVTLTGMGGVGKTRLAIEVACELLEDFQSRVFFIDLSYVNDPGLFFSSIVRGLGLEEAKRRPPLELLKEHLDNRPVLLVLDNFEQLVQAAPFVSDLLRACHGVKALVTSREALRVRGEREIEVPPLDLPISNIALPIEDLMRYESVRLFIERVQDRQFDFTFTDQKVTTIADICRKLDGLPLAIELAAARVKELSPEEMLEQIENRLQFLTGPLVDLPLRQRTLRSTLAWSYNLLDNHERELFRRLAVFSGRITPEGVRALSAADGDPPCNVLTDLERLADKSLLTYAHSRQVDEPHFSMLETVREYAREELVRSGEAASYHRRHAIYYLALAEQAEPEMRGAHQKLWFDRLEDEHDNLRAALQWSLNEDDAELSLLLCGWLTMFWYYRGYTSEGRQWLTKALTRVDEVSTELRAKLFNAAGILAWAQGDFNEAKRSYENSLKVWRELGDKPRIANTLYNIAGVLLVNTEFDRARPILEDLVLMFREAGQKSMLSSTLNRLSIVLEHQGDFQMAETLCQECLELDTEIGDARHLAIVRSRFGDLALRHEQLERANCLFREALSVFSSLDDKEGIAKTLEKLGMVAHALGHPTKMPFLFGASSALRDLIASMWTPLDHAIYSPYLTASRTELGESAWQRAWVAGRAANMEQSIEYALA